MRPSWMAFAGLMLWLLGPAAADEQYSACIDATVKNDEWAGCGGAFIEREEAKMDEAWQRLMELTEGDTTAALKAEQEAWAEFRESACQFYADPGAFGREGQVLSYPNCVAETVASRTAQLKAYLREIDP
ncbi:MAG: lysozyme inhibitor LprI family protein [Rhizobiaceae bacterium]